MEASGHLKVGPKQFLMVGRRSVAEVKAKRQPLR